jgi:hypothetical protein
MCIKEGANEYLCFSTEDGKEMITASKDITHNGNLTQTGNAKIVGKLDVKSAKGAGDINADGAITGKSLNGESATVSGTAKVGTSDYSQERRNGLPTRSLYEIFTLPVDTDLDTSATFTGQPPSTVFDMEQNKRDIIDMNNFLQAEVLNLTKKQLTQLGVRLAAGAATTFTAEEVSLSATTVTHSNSGAAGSVTVYTGKAGIQDATGGAATTSEPTAVAAAGGSRLFVFKNAELNLTAANIVLRFAAAADGIDKDDSQIFVETDGASVSSAFTPPTDGHSRITLDGAAGTIISGFIYCYDSGAASGEMSVKGYLTTNKAITGVTAA